MSFAKNYLKQYNADSAWNSLGAIGSTSAWEGGQNPLSVYNTIQGRSTNLSHPYQLFGSSRYMNGVQSPSFGSNAVTSANFLVNAQPTDLLQKIAGKYLNKADYYSNFF